jgi:hypothetical protein
MNFGSFSYLTTTLIFAGGVLIEYLVARRTLRRFRRVIWIVVVIGLLGTALGERIALAWDLWAYDADRTFYISVFGAELETYLFSLLVCIAVSSATLYWVYCEDRGRSIIYSTYSNLQERITKIFSKRRAST